MGTGDALVKCKAGDLAGAGDASMGGVVDTCVMVCIWDAAVVDARMGVLGNGQR